jgi:hypothetical protein
VVRWTLRPPKKKKLRRIGVSCEEYKMSDGDVQERNPCASLDKRVPYAAVSKSVFKKYVANVTRSREYGEDCKKDFKTVEIVTIRFDCKPKKDIVEDRQKSRSGNTIYRNL